jgi:hypothetical protein
MPLDLDKLLKFPIPRVRQTLTPRDIALYSLSIGMGADPLDQAQLPYVDPLRGPVVMPSMVLVMAHPGFWLAHPDSGVDPASVLHSFQSFAILDVLPQSGVVESQTNVDNAIDGGSGKAALIHYRLNGDLNPLHSNPLTALQAAFPGPILRGLCTMGVVTHALLKSLCAYKPDRLRSISLRFTSPVFPGETICTAIWSDGGFQARVRERDTLVIDGGYCFVSGATATEEVQ